MVVEGGKVAVESGTDGRETEISLGEGRTTQDMRIIE